MYLNVVCSLCREWYCKMQKEQKQDTNNNKREKREKGIQDWLIAISF